MSQLRVTIIDVGWGDSILIESTGNDGQTRYALVDCNDHDNQRVALVFVKQHLEKAGVDWQESQRNFRWVLLTHGHADHARGLKRMLQTFGTETFWYPKSVPSTTQAHLLQYANRSSRVGHHEAVNAGKLFDSVDFGEVELGVLWPNHDQIDTGNENNNSVVMTLRLGTVVFVLTGDVEAENWPEINPRLPAEVRVFQAPHHGARNGMFDAHGAASWLDHLGDSAKVAMSSHIVPHGHPHPDVIARLENPALPIEHYRTDRDVHLVFETDGTDVKVKYSHV